jgi:PAS domain S-box-containing protein
MSFGSTVASVRTWDARRIAWAGGFLIAVIVALAAYDIVESHQTTLRNAGHGLEAQARVLAEQTARSFQAVDVVLRHLARQHQQGAFDAMSDRELYLYLREQAVGLVQIEGLGIFRPDGAPRALSIAHPPPSPSLDVSGMAIFKALKAGHRSLYIDNAVMAFDGYWVLPLGRRIESASGEFSGTAAARGRIEYYEQFYRNVQLDPGTSISLMRQDGTLLARHPRVEEAHGKHLPQFGELLNHSGPIRSVSPVDGVERLGVLKLVPDYPLAVIVTRDVASVLAPWRAQSMGTALRTLALGALAALLLVLLLRQFSRLQASRERYALAVAGSDDGVWEYDLVNKRVFASARAREISGLPPGPEAQSIDEWNAQLKIHAEDAPKRRAAQEAHLAGKTPAYEGEWRMRLPDGRYRWIRIHGLCIRDAEGRPYRMAGSTSDIDVRKRAEEALRASEEQYKAIYNGTTDALILRNREGLIVDVNPAFLRMNGFTREEVMADRSQIFAPPEQRETIRDYYRRACEGETIHYELDVQRKNGRALLDVRIVPVLYAGEMHALSLARDVTAQKRAEEALRQSEEQYRAIFNAAADAFVLRDAEARVVDVNPAFLEISGFTRAEVLQQKRWIFAAPEVSELAKEMHRRVIAGESVQFEIQAIRKDGRRVDIEMRAVPILYRGEPHALGMARDITARKNAEAERARLEGQLLQSKKLEAIGTLAGGIAHDFNNILAAILGYGELAQRSASARPGTALRRHIDAVVAAGMRAKSLVERILAFSRSGVGERTPVHVQSVVTETLDLLAASLPEHVRLERRLEAGDATVLGDATQIHQVVMNLCANALQAMRAKGTLTVALDVVERAEAQAATSRLAAGRYVRLQVRDTGTGIAPGALERIFDPFFTTRGVGVGTGLGLSLVHGIVTDLGGGIEVESALGAGAAFTVYIPWSSAVAVSSAKEDSAPFGDGETILLVDDEEALVRLDEEMIASLGYEPVGFTSSTDALAAFRESPDRFHAVLSDEAMPDLTGSELARQIRAIRREVPIVMMSGYVTPQFAARARELGVNEVLAKPLVARDIARSLANVLNKEAVR